jgi:hypothetical protein
MRTWSSSARGAGPNASRRSRSRRSSSSGRMGRRLRRRTVEGLTQSHTPLTQPGVGVRRESPRRGLGSADGLRRGQDASERQVHPAVGLGDFARDHTHRHGARPTGLPRPDWLGHRDHAPSVVTRDLCSGAHRSRNPPEVDFSGRALIRSQVPRRVGRARRGVRIRSLVGGSRGWRTVCFRGRGGGPPCDRAHRGAPGLRFDATSPWVDARLPDGSRGARDRSAPLSGAVNGRNRADDTCRVSSEQLSALLSLLAAAVIVGPHTCSGGT